MAERPEKFKEKQVIIGSFLIQVSSLSPSILPETFNGVSFHNA
jgi:hypothetical protein